MYVSVKSTCLKTLSKILVTTLWGRCHFSHLLKNYDSENFSVLHVVTQAVRNKLKIKPNLCNSKTMCLLSKKKKKGNVFYFSENVFSQLGLRTHSPLLFYSKYFSMRYLFSLVGEPFWFNPWTLNSLNNVHLVSEWHTPV